MQSRLISVTFFLAQVCMPAVAQDNLDSVDRGVAEIRSVPMNLSWTQVDQSRRPEILELLLTQTKGNFEKIRTWQGSYSFQVMQYLSPAFVADSFSNRLPTDQNIALRQELTFDLGFAIDVTGNRLFLKRTSQPIRYLQVSSDMEVVIPGTSLSNMNSVVTEEQYLYVYPDQKATYAVLPDHPEARRKRAAHKVPREQAEGNERGDVQDPRNFFRGMNDKFVWGNLDAFLSALRDPKGHPNKSAEGMVIDQADDGGQFWYRLRNPLENADGSTTTLTSIWSPHAGYNLVQLTFSAKDAAKPPARILELRWKPFNDIFIPSTVREVWRLESTGVITFQRDATLKQCSVNDPIKPDQFDYRGLGLVDGDLVLDEIEEVVYKIEQGEPVKLANFGEGYVPPIGERLAKNAPSFRWLMIAATLAIIAVLLVLIWRRRTAGV